MAGPARYYSNLPHRPRSRPADALPASGVIADPLMPKSIIGIAYPYTHIGGCQPGDDLRTDPEPPEVVWRIILDRAWIDGKIVNLDDRETLDGRFVLRDGEFLELADDAT